MANLKITCVFLTGLCLVVASHGKSISWRMSLDLFLCASLDDVNNAYGFQNTVTIKALLFSMYERYTKTCRVYKDIYRKHWDRHGRTEERTYPCSRLLIASVGYSTGVSSITWIVKGHSSQFMNLTIDNMKLAHSPNYCFSEGLALKSLANKQTVCGEIQQLSYFLHGNNIYISYYISQKLLSFYYVRSGIGLRGSYVYANYQFGDKKDNSHPRPARNVLYLAKSGYISKYPSTAFNGLFSISSFISSHNRDMREIYTTVVGDVGLRLFAGIQHSNTTSETCFNGVKVYDGPDNRSPELAEVLNISHSIETAYAYYTIRNWDPDSLKKIFQFARIHILSVNIRYSTTDTDCVDQMNNISIHFLSMEFDIPNSHLISDIHIAESSLILDFPNSINNCTLACIVGLTTEVGYYLNITIVDFNINGSNPDCLHQGLVVTPLKPIRGNPSMKHTREFRLCGKILSPTAGGVISENPVPNQYFSPMNHVRLVWYAFPRGHLRARVSIIRTRCRGTTASCNQNTPPQSDPLLKKNTGETWAPFGANVASSPVIKKNMDYTFLYHGQMRRSRTMGSSNITLYLRSPKVECVALQHFALYPPQKSVDECAIGVMPWFRYSEVLTSMIVTAGETSENCQNHLENALTSYTITSRKYQHFSFNPICRSALIVARSSFLSGPKLQTKSIYFLNENVVWAKRHELQQSIDGISKYYKDNSLFTKNFPIRFLWSQVHRQASLINLMCYLHTARESDPSAFYFRDQDAYVLKYAVMITYSVLGPEICKKETFKVAIIHIPKDVDCISSHSKQVNVYYHVFMFKGQESFTIYDIAVYAWRVISVQQSSNNAYEYWKCSLQIKTSSASINGLLPKYHVQNNERTCCADNIKNVYFILITPSNAREGDISWTDASDMCAEIGGHLPEVLSEIDSSLMQHLLSGVRFADPNSKIHYPLNMPARKIMKANIYLGLKSNKGHWESGRPVGFSMFDKYVTHLSRVFRYIKQPKMQVDAQLCTMALWDINHGFKWILVPCNRKHKMSTVICQDSKSSGSESEKETVIAYINTNWNVYPWTLESCFGLSHPPAEDGDTYYGNQFPKAHIVRYNCKSRQLEGQTNMSKELQIRMTKLQSFLAEHYCAGKIKIIPMCLNIVREVSKSLKGDTVVHIHREQERLIKSHLSCPKHSVSLKSYCVLVKQSIAGVCQKNDKNKCLIDILSSFHETCPIESTTFKVLQPIKQIPIHRCAQGQSQCLNQECVSDISINDGEYDCTDHTDEFVNQSHSDQTIAHDRSDMNSREHYYKCTDKLLIPWHLVCDTKIDCPEGKDEIMCQRRSSRLTQFKLENVRDCTCPASGKTIQEFRKNDGVIDCPVTGLHVEHDDGLVDTESYLFSAEDELSTKYTNKVCQFDYLPCPFSLNDQCFPFERICVFDKGQQGRMKYCANGGHLQYCIHTGCAGFYKCPNSYCLALSRVCDGSKDCPDGEEEEGCVKNANLSCPGMYRCKGTMQCLHLVHTCDGIKDCDKYGDDEWLCDLSSCPADCQCLATSMICDSTSVKLLNVSGFSSVQVRESNLTSIDKAKSLLRLTYVHGSAFIPPLDNGESIVYLDLMFNCLEANLDILRSFQNVQELNLSHNQIVSWESELFDHMKHLSILDLSFNKLFTFSILHTTSAKQIVVTHNVLQHLRVNLARIAYLKLLDVANNSLDYLRINGTENDYELTVVADTHYICCLLKSTSCFTENNRSISCESWFTVAEYICMWFMGPLVSISSIICISFSLFSRKKQATVTAVYQSLLGVLISVHICCILVKENVNMVNNLIHYGALTRTLCLVASIVQTSVCAIHMVLGVMYVAEISRITRALRVITRMSKRKMHLIHVLICVNITAVVAVCTVVFVSPDEIGQSCSVLLGELKSISSMVYTAVIVAFNIICNCLQIAYTVRITRAITDSSKALRNLGSSSTRRNNKVTKKLIFMAAHQTALDFCLLLFNCLNVSGITLTPRIPFILSVVVIPALLLISQNEVLQSIWNRMFDHDKAKEVGSYKTSSMYSRIARL